MLKILQARLQQYVNHELPDVQAGFRKGRGSRDQIANIKAVYCHPAYLTYMKGTSCKMPGWMKPKLESRLSGEISITLDIQMTSPLWQKVKRN